MTIREQTEWIELTVNGFNVLAGTEKGKIFDCYRMMINRESDYNINLYGNGKASVIIVKYLLK